MVSTCMSKNFLECLKNNTPQKLNAGINVGRDVALVAQMGNIAFRTGEKVNWDDTKQTFSDKYCKQVDST